MELAPVILFVYKRPQHTFKTIESLQNNKLGEKTDLFIYSDAPKEEKDRMKVRQVRTLIKKVSGFKSVKIIFRNQNIGLAKNIIQGTSEIIRERNKAIIMEDDLVSSPYFLGYMNEALDFYKDFPKLFSVTGYNHPPSLMKFPSSYEEDVYFNYRNSSWGWGTWQDRWEKADWQVKDAKEFMGNPDIQKRFNRGGEDMSEMLIAQLENEIDSWAIRWSYTHFKHDGYSLYPVKSYIDNIGIDGSGTHCKDSGIYSNNLSYALKSVDFPREIRINEAVMNEFRKVYKKKLISRFKKQIKKRLFKYVNI